MLYTAATFFLLAALLGIYLISFVLAKKTTPKGIVFIHGPLAFTGLVVLIIYACLYHPAPIVVSMILFILAAIGGIILITRDILGKSVPSWMALGHGFTAIIAFGFLLYFIFY